MKYPWKIKWTTRAKYAIEYMPENPSIIDIGGGLGEIYELLGGRCDYTSIDIQKWNEHTITADLNDRRFYPILPKKQFVLCLGVIEYITDPERFLKEIRKYSERLIISYRTAGLKNSDKKNNLYFKQFQNLLKNCGWMILAQRYITDKQYIYFCIKTEKNDKSILAPEQKLWRHAHADSSRAFHWPKG